MDGNLECPGCKKIQPFQSYNYSSITGRFTCPTCKCALEAQYSKKHDLLILWLAPLSLLSILSMRRPQPDVYAVSLSLTLFTTAIVWSLISEKRIQRLAHYAGWQISLGDLLIAVGYFGFIGLFLLEERLFPLFAFSLVHAVFATLKACRDAMSAP